MFNLLIGNKDDYRIYYKRTKGEAKRKHFFYPGDWELLLLLLVESDEKKKLDLYFQLKQGGEKNTILLGCVLWISVFLFIANTVSRFENRTSLCPYIRKITWFAMAWLNSVSGKNMSPAQAYSKLHKM